MMARTATRIPASPLMKLARILALLLAAAALVCLALGVRGLMARGALSTDAQEVVGIVLDAQRAPDLAAWGQQQIDTLGKKSSLNRQDRYRLLVAMQAVTQPTPDAPAAPLAEDMLALMKKTRGTYTADNIAGETEKLLALAGIAHVNAPNAVLGRIGASGAWLRATGLCLLGAALLWALYDWRTRSGRMFDVCNHVLLGALALLMVAPLVYVVIGSFSSTGMKNGFTAFSLKAYQDIFTTPTLAKATLNSVIITLVGTAINISVTAMTAYVLSKKSLPGRGVLLRLVMIFMLFHPGIIPDFIQVDSLGLLGTFWAIWLPIAINASNLLIMKNFFQQLPESIEESARIDGCNDLQSFVRIVLPMSSASIATFSLFYAVAHWNNYFRAMIYLNQPEWPIQVWLRQLVILSLGGLGAENLSEEMTLAAPDAMKYATIVVATLPIILVYPSLQKHFAKGMLLGSVKG